MLVDHERVLLELKAAIAGKPSHGARDLLATIARLEAEHAIPADDYERFMRRFGAHLYDSFMGLVPHVDEDYHPLTDAAAPAAAMAGDPHLQRPTTHSEDSCQTRTSSTTDSPATATGRRSLVPQ